MIPRRSMRFTALALATALLLLESGCASYRPLALDAEAVERALAVPGTEEVKIRARAFDHPMLAPVEFDPRDGLSADEAAILAVLANPSLRALRDRRGVAAAQLLQAGVLPNPRLSLSLDAPVGGGAAGKVPGLGLGLDWMVTSLLSRNARVDAARARASVVDLEVAWGEWRVAESARLLICRLRLAAEREAAAVRWSEIADRRHEAAAKGLQKRLRTVGVVASARAGVHDAAAARLDAEAWKIASTLALDRILGLPAGTPVVAEEGTALRFLEEPPPEAELVRDLPRRRLDLLALAKGYESREARVRDAVASRFPRIEVGPTADRDTDGNSTAGAAVSVELPVFDDGRHRVAIEGATRRQLFDEYVARLFEARSEVSRLVRELRGVRRKTEEVEGALRARRDLTDRYRSAAAGGVSDVLHYHAAAADVERLELDRLDLAGRAAELAVALEVASGRTLFSPGSGERPEAGNR